ncbi:MAG: 50S ribosomal protein L29 [Candidatus Moeniiplasma glomeromycotorum]|nr:50S ribosomal protein L29 [Candidatus Moeniiplasma glomeromycotorum]MCE8167155.1 50S ribosomal protein L29 [Candidatus Moeniiplasma glomeromycotorum]MCE8168833.1 50S ribosomal protein L29 [Candidatus Moeniiplasma glomeromycotorum]
MDKDKKSNKKSKANTKSADKTPKSPTEMLKDYRFKLNLLQIQHRMGNLPTHQTYHLRLLRKEIARLLTKMNMSKKDKNI